MQVGLRVWYDTGSSTDTPGHDATCGGQGLLDSLGSQLASSPPMGKEAVGCHRLAHPPANGPAP